MLAPSASNAVPPFGQWGRSDRSMDLPYEYGIGTIRLGPMAAIGLLFLLMVSTGLVRHRDTEESAVIETMASLALYCLLLATVGGFGALLSQIFPDIRCYNRLSVFIAFLALAGSGLWWQTRIQTAVARHARKLFVGGFIVLLAFSLYDQLLDARWLNERRPADEMSAMRERGLVKQIEAKAPAGTAVFQLPITGFPIDVTRERMLTYDHARPSLWSSHLCWSWPSFSRRHQCWLNKVDGLKGADLAEALVLSKFRLIWVDRFGYPDNGASMISSLIGGGAKDLLPAADPRYVVLDLSEVAARLQRELGAEQFARRQVTLLQSP
jgi:phosphoglycerol transferase